MLGFIEAVHSLSNLYYIEYPVACGGVRRRLFDQLRALKIQNNFNRVEAMNKRKIKKRDNSANNFNMT
jgi:hypothetical protein